MILARSGILVLVLARLAAAEPTTEYVQLGAQVGDEQTNAFAAAKLDLGYRVYDRLWVHAGGGIGAPFAFNLGGDLGDEHHVSGSLKEFGIGVEARTCASTSLVLCGAVGLDVGYKSVRYADMDSTNPSQSLSFYHGSAVAIPRFQLEVGSNRIRVRPTIEVPVGADVTALEVVIAVALQL